MAGESACLDMTELRLGLPFMGKKRDFSCVSTVADDESSTCEKKSCLSLTRDAVVGWPPVCSFRQKIAGVFPEKKNLYVKVSMDGAPFLRKIDLSSHGGYPDLLLGLRRLFASFDVDGRHFLRCRTASDASAACLESHDSKCSNYAVLYEDDEEDWLLLADVPWRLFTTSCRKLRIMKIP